MAPTRCDNTAAASRWRVTAWPRRPADRRSAVSVHVVRAVSTNDLGDARDVRHDPLVGGDRDDNGGRPGIERQSGFDLLGCWAQYYVEPDIAAGMKPTLTLLTIAACLTL